MANPVPLQHRLMSAFSRVSELLEICRVPSISVGVLHQGEVVFTSCVGSREIDMESGEERTFPAAPRTAYLLASCSEIFLACAVGILVEEAKMAWHDPIRKYVPEFNVVGDKRISQGATIRHAMCHITGLGRQDSLIQGIRGNILVDEDGFVALINHAPTHAGPGEDATADDKDQAGRGEKSTISQVDQNSAADGESNNDFRERKFLYNSYATALVALAVQNASGQRYYAFIKTRILDPLGMKGTIVTRNGLGNHRSLAVGYAKLSDSTFSKLATEALTDEAHTPVLSAVGVRSSVDDMLKLAEAMCSAYSYEVEKSEEHNQSEPPNPLRQLATIWTSWAEVGEGLSFGMGCAKFVFPSFAFNMVGMNTKTWTEDPRFFKSHLVGLHSIISGVHLEDNVVLHKGNTNGFTSSFTIFPRTQTAIVALANGLDLGDPADWASKILAQALFDTTPQVDIFPLATKEAALWKKWFDNILIQWLQDRSITHQESDLKDYIGKYEGVNTSVDIFMNTETARLAMKMNSCEGSRFDLELYAKDAYSFMPLTKDDWLQRGMRDWEEYHVTVLYFHRNENGEVYRFSWRYLTDEEDGQF